MRFHHVPRPLLQLVTTILLAPTLTIAHPALEGAISPDQLFARDCSPCGFYNQLCCYDGTGCYTDANQQATCTPNSGAVTQAAGASGWQYWTTTIVETDLVTRTTVMSSFVGGAAAATATAVCNAGNQPCGPICCASDQYCFQLGQCAAAAAGSTASGSSGGGATGIAGAPIRPTTSGTVVITATVSPSTTIPYMTPVPTGANVTVTEGESSGGGGLSGGAIAGIVIGVLAGLLLLALLIFYCCVRGLWVAIFGGRRKRTTEVEEYERRSHHTHGGGGRTWYGAPKPSTRVERTERHDHKGRNLLGIGAGLAALWAILGLKRRRDNRRRDEKSEYSFSSDYYYTSASSASSDDRRTRDTRRSMSRR